MPSLALRIACRRIAAAAMLTTLVTAAVGLATRQAAAAVSAGARASEAGFAVQLKQPNVFPGSVSCLSATSCIAANTMDGGLMSYEGTTWTPIPTFRQTHVSHVRCLPTGACVAVGTRFSLTRGSATAPWVRTPVPMFQHIGPHPMIQDLSCARFTRCLAVGYWQPSDQLHTWPIAMEWNGTSWTRLPQPQGYTGYGMYTFNSVSCAAQSCLLNGYAWPDGAAKGHPVFGVWQARRPALREMPTSSTWRGVSVDTVNCFIGLHCVGIAIGYLPTDHEKPFYFGVSFNRGVWTRSALALPAARDRAIDADPDEVPEISCTSASHCVMLGEYSSTLWGLSHPLAAGWNGRAWQLIPVGVSLADTTGLSCPSNDFCLGTANTIAAGTSDGTSGGLTLTRR